MESLTLTKPSQSQCKQPQLTLADLIDEWLPKLAVNAGAALDARTQTVFRAIWLEGLGDLPPAVVRAAFQRALRESAYNWPVKVADIRKHIAHAEANAAPQAAEQAWERVLEIRRVYWNPDIPGPFDRAVAKLPERIKQAARASGVFRDHESVEALHVWAKKKFLESFIAYGELEQDQFLLPDGEIKNLLAQCSETKALPAPPKPSFAELHKRGLEYADKLKSEPSQQPDIKRAIRAVAAELAPRPPVRSLAEQKEILRQRGLLK